MERTDNKNSMVEGPSASLKSFCLLCGSSSLAMVKIFTEEGLFSELGVNINLYLPVEVQKGDGQPEQCCSNCTYTIMSWHNLYLTCLKRQEIYQKVLEKSALEQPEVHIKTDVVTEEQEDLDPQNKETTELEDLVVTSQEVNKDNLMETLEDSDHEEVEENEHEKDKVPCSICGVVYMKESMKLHLLRDHSDERPDAFTCKVCNKTLSTRRSLNYHIKVMHENGTARKKYPCHICGFLTEKSHLKEHLTKHSDVRPFACEVCGKSFKLERYLTRHTLTHSKRIT